MLAIAADVLSYAAGAALIGFLVRLWRPELRWRLVAAYGFLAALFLSPALLTPRSHLATDLVYQVGPWAQTLDERPEPQNGLLQDPVRQMLPFRTLVRDRWLSGQIPLWAHEMGTGQPLWGNGQSAPLAPLHLMALPVPPLRGMTLAVGWQMLLAMLLLHALVGALATPGDGGPRPTLRMSGRTRWGAVLAAVAYGWSVYSVVWAYHPHAMAAAWLPGVLLGLVEVMRNRPRGFGALVACAVGLALAGHPETLAHAALGAAGVVGWWMIRGFDGSRLRALGRLAAAGLVAFALAAPVLLPILETVEESTRLHRLQTSERSREHVEPPPVSKPYLVMLVAPWVYGDPVEYQGPSNFNEIAGGYAGFLPLVLASGGALMYRRRILAILSGGLVAVATALGIEPFWSLVSHVPLLEHGAHGRLRLLFVLAVTVAAGLTLERWIGQGVQAVRNGSRRRLVGLALVALTALELAWLGVGYHPTPAPHLDLEAPPSVAFLQERMDEAGPFRVLGEGWILVPNLAAYYGLWDPRADDPAAPWAATRFVAQRMTGETGPRVAALELPGTYDEGLHRFLGVRWVLTRRGGAVDEPWRLGPKRAGTWLWRLPRSGSLFFVPPRVEAAPDRASALTRGLELAEPAAVAVTEAPFPSVQQGQAHVDRVTANGFDLTVESSAGAVVTSSVSWAPGWRVESNQDRWEPLRIHGAFLGFEAPPGVHEVRLRYEPATWRLAWGLWSLGVLSLLLARWRWGGGPGRGRSRPAPPSP